MEFTYKMKGEEFVYEPKEKDVLDAVTYTLFRHFFKDGEYSLNANYCFTVQKCLKNFIDTYDLTNMLAKDLRLELHEFFVEYAEEEFENRG